MQDYHRIFTKWRIHHEIHSIKNLQKILMAFRNQIDKKFTSYTIFITQRKIPYSGEPQLALQHCNRLIPSFTNTTSQFTRNLVLVNSCRAKKMKERKKGRKRETCKLQWERRRKKTAPFFFRIRDLRRKKGPNGEGEDGLFLQIWFHSSSFFSFLDQILEKVFQRFSAFSLWHFSIFTTRNLEKHSFRGF